MWKLSVSIVLMSFLVGCQTVTPEPETAEPLETELVNEEVITKESNTPINYQDWAMQKPESYSDDFRLSQVTSNPQSDCLGMENGHPLGGDLLSSLIVDSEFRSDLDLSTYTPEYITALEQKVARWSKQNHNSNFYAYYSCNLDNNLDLVGGQETGSWDARKQFIVLVNQDSVIELTEQSSLLNSTATGGEVYPCETIKTANEFTIKCFRGFVINEGITSHSKYESDTYNFNGQHLKNEIITLEN